MVPVQIEVIPYDSSLGPFFRELNYEWLNKYFFITEEDDKILSDPEKIITDGGCVLFAKSGDEIIGTCALIKIMEDHYEIAKMAVTEKYQGKGAGFQLMLAIVEEAKKRKVKIISLDTARELKAAISLYSKFGFIQIEEERIHPVFGRKTFRMELHLNSSI